MGKIVGSAVVFIVLSGLYLFLAGSVDPVEITAMVICAAAATILIVAVEIVAKRNYGGVPPLKAILRPLAALLPEAIVVGRELSSVAITGTSRQRGVFVQQPFEPGADDPHSAGRRALSVIGVSMAPRTFVIRGELGEALLLHGFPPKPLSPDTRWPA